MNEGASLMSEALFVILQIGLRSRNDDNFVKLIDIIVKVTDKSMKMTDNFAQVTDNCWEMKSMKRTVPASSKVMIW